MQQLRKEGGGEEDLVVGRKCSKQGKAKGGISFRRGTRKVLRRGRVRVCTSLLTKPLR